jgi:hypothetical protein
LWRNWYLRCRDIAWSKTLVICGVGLLFAAGRLLAAVMSDPVLVLMGMRSPFLFPPLNWVKALRLIQDPIRTVFCKRLSH